jgi:hypothetical protein
VAWLHFDNFPHVISKGPVNQFIDTRDNQGRKATQKEASPRRAMYLDRPQAFEANLPNGARRGPASQNRTAHFDTPAHLHGGSTEWIQMK